MTVYGSLSGNEYYREVFFSSPADLETYTNGMYGYIGASYSDTPSDNMLYPEDTDIYKMMRGEYRADNIGKWSWSNIRTVNFMLARTGRVEGDRGEIDHYIGWHVCFVHWSIIQR